MILPKPSIQLEPGHKVVVFVHHLKEGLSSEQLAEYRRMDDDTLALAMGMDGYLGHEYASNDQGRRGRGRMVAASVASRGQSEGTGRMVRVVPYRNLHRRPAPPSILSNCPSFSAQIP